MSNSESDKSTDGSSNGGFHGEHPLLAKGNSESLELLVWLTTLWQDEVLPQEIDVTTRKLASPKWVGRFRLDSLIGFGAYGAVFRATDTHLGREVALKLAWPSVLIDPLLSRRFVDEPKTVALLKHPGIVAVHDSGTVGLVGFIAFELVEGPNLAEWLEEQQQVPPRLAAHIVLDVALAVNDAHDHGVIHRDLKPSNILLRPPNAKGPLPFEPVVTDFGLAQGPRPAGTPLLTAPQAVLGTDHYMSPEQAAGLTAEVGPASDIFSLGVILYESVAGERPFEGGKPHEIRRQICEGDAAPVSHKRRGIPRDLETIISKCLEKSPNRRYATARDLADELGRFLRNEPIVARPAGYVERAWKYSKRKPTVVALAVSAVLGSLVIAALVGAWISDRMSAADEIAAAQSATTVAEHMERQHQYASNIQHAAAALRRGQRREVLALLEQCRSLVPGKERCGIEWDWIWAEANAAAHTLHAHPNGVCAVRFSPRGNLLASGGNDGRVILWDAKSWKKSCELTYADSQEVNAVEFSADGSLLAAGGSDGRLVVYHVGDQSVIYDESIIDGRVFDLAWIGDSKEIAVGGDGPVLSVVAVLTGECRKQVLAVSPEGRTFGGGHPDEISAVIFVPSRNAIGVFLSPPSVYFVDAGSLDTTASSLSTLPIVGAVCNIQFESGYLAATTGETGGGSVGVFKADDGSIAASVNFSGHVKALRYSPEARAMAVAFRDGAIQTCKVEALLAGGTLNDRRHCAHNDRAVSLDFSPDGALVGSAGWDGDIKLWNVASLNEAFDVPLSGRPSRIEFSKCGRWLAIGLESQQERWELNVLDARSGASLWSTKFATVPGTPSGANAWVSVFDPLGTEIALADSSSVRTFDAGTGASKTTYSIPARDSTARLAYSLDGRWLITRWPYADDLVFDRRVGAKPDGAADSAPTTLGMFRTICGDVWLVMGPSHELVLVATGSREPIMTLLGPTEKAESVTVSEDGRYLAAGGHEGVIYFWDLNNPSFGGKCVGHEDTIKDICFSPDGRRILSRSDDGTVRIWDVATRAELLQFGSRQQPVTSMGLNRDATLLVLGIRDGDRFGLRIHRLGEKSRSLLRSLQSF